MTLLTGLTPDGIEIPVQVKPDGRLVAEGLTGPQGGVGPQGPQGVAGPAGPAGPVGQAQPPGAVIWFAGPYTPDGWLYCNGQAVSRSTYAALHAVIGTIYGAGDGTGTFNLPDLRGEFVRGLDDGRGVDAGRVIGSRQTGAIQSHEHPVNLYNAPGGAYQAQQTGSNAGVGQIWTGASGGTETRPRNVAMRALIKT